MVSQLLFLRTEKCGQLSLNIHVISLYLISLKILLKKAKIAFINLLPNNTIFDWPKFKAFADDNLNLASQ